MFLINIYLNKLLTFIIISIGFYTVEPAPYPHVNNAVISKNTESKFQINLPLTDINFKITRSVEIFTVESSIFVIHGAELYSVVISQQRKEMRLIGRLNGDVTDFNILGAEGVVWKSHFLIILALSDHFEVYQLPWNTSSISSKAPIDPIQKISSYGDYVNVKFLKNRDTDQLFLISAVNFTSLNGRLSLYEWYFSYFRDSEQRNIQAVDSMHVVGDKDPLIVTIRYHKLKTSIYTFMLTNSRLATVKSLLLRLSKVYPFAFRETKYLLGCGNKNTCNLFVMDASTERFYEINQGLSKMNDSLPNFKTFAAGPNFLVGQSSANIYVYMDVKMECFGAFKTIADNLTAITPYKDFEGNNFIMLSYVQKNNLLLRVVEVEVNEDLERDKETVSKAHVDKYQQSMDHVKNALLISKSNLNSIKETLDLLQNSFVSKSPLHIRRGHIQQIRVVGRWVRSPSELCLKVKQLTAMLKIFDSQQKRSTRQIDYTGDGRKSIKTTVLKVNNLIYNGTLFEGMKHSAHNRTLRITIPVVTDTIVAKSYNNRSRSFNSNDKYRSFADNSTIQGNVSTKVLFAKTINGIEWKTLLSKVFLRGRDRTVKGNLVFRSKSQVDSLTTNTLNSILVSSLFDLVTDQNITSNVIISRFFITSLDSNSINGLNFQTDVALIGRDNVIKSSVAIAKMGIVGNMTLADDDHRARHIFGTQFQDFQQIYTGRVFINGSLMISNLNVETGLIRLQEEDFNLDFVNEYWLGNIDQTINRAVFKNSQIRTPQLHTQSLRNHPIRDYLRVDISDPLGYTLLVMNTSDIRGSVFTEPKYPASLNRIHENAVFFGTRAEIQGRKVFKAPIVSESLLANSINDISVDDLVKKNSDLQTISGHKHFSNMRTDILEVHSNMDVEVLNNDTVISDFLKFQFDFDKIVMRKPMVAKNLNIKYINGLEVAKVFNCVEKVGDELILHKHVTIDGVAHFDKDLNVSWINGLEWSRYRKTLVSPEDAEHVLEGKKIFQNGLVLKNDVDLQILNGRNVSEFFGNILSKSRPQIITGMWTLESVTADNVEAGLINNVSTADFIDLRNEHNVIYSEVVVETSEIARNLTGDCNLDLESVHSLAQSINKEQWVRVEIVEQAVCPKQDETKNLIEYLYSYAVRRDADQVITGNVTFEKPFINSMSAKDSVLRNVDLEFISRDCLYKWSQEPQLIDATKNFIRPIQINQMTAKGLVRTPFVNSVDFIAFNKSAYRIDSGVLLENKLSFAKTLKVKSLTVTGLINGLDIAQVYCQRTNESMPPIKIANLIVSDDLKIKNMNKFEFDAFLQSVVRKDGSAQEVYGYLTFDDVILTKNISIQSINDIQIDNVFLSNYSAGVQEVSGEKTIIGNVSIVGPASVINLNDKDLIETYRKTVFLDRNYRFGEVYLENAAFKNGATVRKMLNEYDFDLYLNWPHRMYDKFEKYLQKINSTLQLVKNNADSISLSHKKLMYFEMDRNTVIEWNQPLDETFMLIKQYTEDTICNGNENLIYYSKLRNRLVMNAQPIPQVNEITDYLNATVDLDCSHKSSVVKLTWKLPNIPGSFYKELKFDAIAEKINVIDNKSSLHIKYLLIEMNSETGKEVKVLKFNLYEQDLVEIETKFNAIHAFKFQSITFVVGKSNDGKMSVFEFNENLERFENIQQIEDDSHKIELIEISKQKHHLLTTCEGCQQLSIFEFDARQTNKFEVIQIVPLSFEIYKIVQFHITTERYFILIPKTLFNSYHIYKYDYLQGWRSIVVGFFDNIRDIVPLNRAGHQDYVTDLLLLAEDRINLLSLYILG